MRKDLPVEHDGPLDFSQLIEVLDTLVGERVCLPQDPPGSGLEVAGVLRRSKAGHAYDHSFAIGDSAWLNLSERDLRAANLRTLDGNDLFSVKIELDQRTVFLGDIVLYGADRADPNSDWYEGT